MSDKPNKAEAMALLRKYNESEALIRHGINVSYVMEHFAKIMNESDVEKWGVIGLLHDLDYEKYPDEHCSKVIEILRDEGVCEEYITSIISHGYGLCSDVKPKHEMEKVLYAIDELTGLINAAALMRPSKSVMDIEYKSVIKKYKNPSFAAGVDRSVIENGCEMMGKDLQYVIEQVILGMRDAEQAMGSL
jgi:putative nucleotidyltransferase with HDIG domain